MLVPKAFRKCWDVPVIACGERAWHKVAKDAANSGGAILDRVHDSAMRTGIANVLVLFSGKGLVVIRNGNLQDFISSRATDVYLHSGSNEP